MNHPDSFCYICGEYTLEQNRKNITDFVKQSYKAYFGIKLGDQDKSWAPHKVCKQCVESLRQWTTGKRKSMSFGVPMVWREQRNHLDDCYFCQVCVKGYNRHKKRLIEYPNIESARRPEKHSEDVPVPVFTALLDLTDDEDEESSLEDDASGCDYQPPSLGSELFSQFELNDLVRDLSLPKKAAELLASRLNEKKCLQPEVRITAYRTREKEFLQYYAQEESLVYCSDVPGLLRHLGLVEYHPENWRLFIDASTSSLKCVLLHNGNDYSPIPLAHSTTMKEQYENIKVILEKIRYDEHRWYICVDLKMVNFLLGQQSGYTKYPCFLCMWDSRAKKDHWVKKVWPPRMNMNVGAANIINIPLVEREKIIFPPLHIKLGLMKQLVKALKKDGECFQYICKSFPGLSNEKLKAGIFDGPKIRKLIRDQRFPTSMNPEEASAWQSFVAVVQNFLGNHRADNYEEIVNNMLTAFKNLGCNMSVKVHFLHSHLDRFPENLGHFSEEQGERFHQDIRTMEERYQGHWDKHMMADYCWGLIRESPDAEHKRRSKKQCFLRV